MPVYLVAAAVALLYLANVPVTAAVEINLGGENTLHAGIGVFGHARIITLNVPMRPRRRKKPRSKKKRVSFSALRYLFRHGEVTSLRVAVGLQDAAATALAAGTIKIILSVFSDGADVKPVFGSAKSRLRALCIAQVPLGHIMAAVALALTGKKGKDEIK